jgi:hypothetical protein
VLLTTLLGAPAYRGARPVGKVVDLAAARRGPTPVVIGLVVERSRRSPVWVPWGEVRELEPHRAVLDDGAALKRVPGGVLLARDVLDAQLVDLAGRRVVRVGDIDLRRAGALMHVDGVEVGLDTVLRRLGLHALAGHARRQRIAWSDIRLPAHPGAALSLHEPPAVERLSGRDRVRLASRLPPRAAAALRVPRRLIRHRFPTHVVRRRRASP